MVKLGIDHKNRERKIILYETMYLVVKGQTEN